LKSRAWTNEREARLRLRVRVPDDLPDLVNVMMNGAKLIVTDRARFATLGSGRGQARFRFTKSHAERHLRRLEACAKMMMSISFHADLPTLRNGRTRRDKRRSCDAVPTYTPRKVKGRKAPPAIARELVSHQKETGLRTSAIAEAVRDLETAELLVRHQPRKRYLTKSGLPAYRAFPVVYQVTQRFLECIRPADQTPEQWMAWVNEQRDEASRNQWCEPAPLADVIELRARQRLTRDLAMAAKRAQLRAYDDQAKVQLERVRLALLERKKLE
jgi:hypothetical protein